MSESQDLYPRIELDRSKVLSFCQKWRISELTLFGSVLTDEFRDDSDVDVMVVFESGARWTVIDLRRMEREFAAIVGRKVDILTRAGVEQMDNYIRRESILRGSRVWYAAR